MPNELIRYARGELQPRRVDREVARAGRVIFEEVRLAAMQVDGAVALAGHIYEGVVELDAYRRSLGRDDVVLQLQLGEIQHTALRQIQRIQANLYSDWSL